MPEDETVNIGGMDFAIISSYTLEQALEDKVLVTFAKERWQQLSGGKPIVMTAAIAETLSLPEIVSQWNKYVHWRNEVMMTLPEEDQMYSDTVRGRDVWVLEDGAAFTILFKEDY